MIGALVRRFVRDSDKTEDPAVRERYGMLAGGVGLALNLLLFVGKLVAGLISGAISITADAFNNLSDAASSVVTLIGFRMAGQEPDREHPFGHGRAEYLAGLAVSVLILLVGVELGRSSIEKILHPEAVEFSWLSAGVLACSILVKLWMGRFNRVLGRRIGSPAMAAAAADSRSDAAATSAVLVGLIVGGFSSLNIDGWIGLLVALFILKAGLGAMKDTLDPLLGQPPSEELVGEIEKTILAHPEITGIHDLVVHDYGPGRQMMSAHAEVDAASDLLEIHDVIDAAERELKQRFHLEAVIHMDPVAVNDPQTMALRERMRTLVRAIDPAVTVHDFRVTAGPLHTNLIFDMVVPYSVKDTDRALRERVQDLVRNEMGDRYYTVIEIDRAYVR